MKIIKTWNIPSLEGGWPQFDTEVRLLTQGRGDVKLFASSPGKLILIERDAKPPASASKEAA
jgi:hypothetical protein